MGCGGTSRTKSTAATRNDRKELDFEPLQSLRQAASKILGRRSLLVYFLLQAVDTVTNNP
jgi:hypothetical protein